MAPRDANIELGDLVDSAGRQIAANEAAAAAFLEFFRDSKIVDPSSGRPLLLLHGTRPGNDIRQFHIAEHGHEGIYFTPDPQYAQSYTCDISGRDEQAAGAIYPVYVSIKNPFVVLANDDSPEWEQFVYRGFNRSEMISKGFDGAVLQHRPSGEIDQVVAYFPEQIKSAIGNLGSFDKANPDITDGNTLQIGVRIDMDECPLAALTCERDREQKSRRRFRP